MNVAAFRSNRRARRRCVAHQQRCRRFRKEGFFDHLSARHRSSDPIVRSLVLTIQVGVGLWPGVPVETWSEIPRVELSIVFRFAQKSRNVLGHSQNHLAVAGGYAVGSNRMGCAPTRYREVVLTVSKLGSALMPAVCVNLCRLTQQDE